MKTRFSSKIKLEHSLFAKEVSYIVQEPATEVFTPFLTKDLTT